MQRRQFLSLAGLLAFPFTVFANKRAKTPSDVEGPFYPLEPIPLRSQLINTPNLSEDAVMSLQGRLFNVDGSPLQKAKIEIWQCDAKGVYDHPYASNYQNFDKRFAGFGAQLSDAQGNYAFNTLYPVPYTGRPPHIHIKIWHQEKEQLTTQIYLKTSTDRLWSLARRDLLEIKPIQLENNQYQASFDFIV